MSTQWDINPEDFTKELTHFLEHQPGPESFDAFIARHLHQIRYAFTASEGSLNPVAALSDGRMERLYSPEDGERLAPLFDRLAATAKATGANRFFFYRLISTDTARPKAYDTLMWFAEDLVSERQRVGGIELDGTHLGKASEYDELNEPAKSLLSMVLHS